MAWRCSRWRCSAVVRGYLASPSSADLTTKRYDTNVFVMWVTQLIARRFRKWGRFLSEKNMDEKLNGQRRYRDSAPCFAKCLMNDARYWLWDINPQVKGWTAQVRNVEQLLQLRFSQSRITLKCFRVIRDHGLSNVASGRIHWFNTKRVSMCVGRGDIRNIGRHVSYTQR